MSQQNRAFQPPGFNNSSSWREKGFLSLTWVRKIIQKILANAGKTLFSEYLSNSPECSQPDFAAS